MTKKENGAVEKYMARPDLTEANPEFIGPRADWTILIEAIEASEAKAAPLAAELAKWQALAQSPWEAPAGLLEAVAALERDYPVTLPLALAIDLMAFGNEAAPAGEAMNGQLEAGARRRRARQALLDAAGQAKFPLEHGPDCLPIKPGRFKFIQGPGLDGDSLEFNDLKEGEPDKRLHVVQIVEAGKFYAWLCERSGGPRKEVSSDLPPKGGAKRGRKLQYDWIEGKEKFDRLMAERGNLDDDTPNWSKKADICRALAEHMKKHGNLKQGSEGKEPPWSLLMEKVTDWLRASGN